jgi:Ca-activated chloride channel family protein
MLVALLAVPLLIALYVWMQRRRQRYALRYASLSLVREAMAKGPGIRRHIPVALFLLALTAMIFGLARPVASVTVPKQEGTVILAIDVSGSMFATDLEPDRMEAAKAAARTFVKRQPKSVRIGVVSFTDNAFIVQAPTTDQDAVVAAINRLRPQRGTAVGRGLEASLAAIFETPDANDGVGSGGGRGTPTPTPTPTPVAKGEYAPAIIVLLTDGENNQGPEPVDVAEQASERGVRVYSVGIGSAEGSIVRIQGRATRTRLDEATLRRVSEITDGAYYNASSEEDLNAIYQNLGTQLALKKERTEVTAIATGVAVVFSLIGGALSLAWFNRLP